MSNSTSQTPTSKIVSLLAKLSSLKPKEMQQILAQTKLPKNHHPLISEQDFSKIIAYLNSPKLNQASLVVSKDLNGWVLAKEVTGLSYKLVINSSGKLFILTNRNYYHFQHKKIAKYHSLHPQVFFGRGATKVAKVCIGLNLDDSDQLNVSLDARLACYLTSTKNLKLTAEKINEINSRLCHAISSDEICQILCQELTDEHLKDYLEALNEVKNSQIINGNLINKLSISNPFLKMDKKNNLLFKVYMFDRKEDYGALGLKTNGGYVIPEQLKVIIPHDVVKSFTFLSDIRKQEVIDSYACHSVPVLLENFVNQLLEAMQQLHSQGILHGDLKGQNILVNHELKLRLIDFGSSLNVVEHLKATCELLKLLGYQGQCDGYIEGKILSYRHVQSLLVYLRADVQKVVKYQELAAKRQPELTLNSLSSHISQVIHSFKQLCFFSLQTTASHSSPEIYAKDRGLYNGGEKNRHILSVEIVKILGEVSNSLILQTYDFKHDVWAAGVSIFEIILGRYVTSAPLDLAIIMLNPFLLGMLHPDIAQRLTIVEVIAQRTQNFKITLPQSQQEIQLLAKNYINLVHALKRKLEEPLERINNLKLFNNLNALCSKKDCLLEQVSGLTITNNLYPQKMQLFNQLDELLSQLKKFNYHECFLNPGLEIEVLYEYLHNNSERQQKTFAYWSFEIIFVYIKKYFDFMAKVDNPVIMASAIEQVMNMAVLNLLMAPNYKKKIFSNLIFSLIEGKYAFNGFYQLMLASALIDALQAQDIVNSNNQTLLHVILSMPSSVNDWMYYNFVTNLIQFPALCSFDHYDKNQQTILELVIRKRWCEVNQKGHDILIIAVLNSNYSLKDLQAALYTLFAYNANPNAIEWLVGRIKQLNPAWDNYSLKSMNRLSVWHKLNDFVNVNLCGYLQVLKLPMTCVLDDIFLTIQPHFIPWHVAVLLTNTHLMQALNFNATNNVLCYLASKPELCEVLNQYPNVVKDNLLRKITNDLSDKLQKMFLGSDLEFNAIGVARNYKNAEFLLFLLKEIMPVFPNIFSDNTKTLHLTSVFMEVSQSKDISGILNSLDKCTNTIDPNIDWSFIVYVKHLLQQIDALSNHEDSVLIFSHKQVENINHPNNPTNVKLANNLASAQVRQPYI